MILTLRVTGAVCVNVGNGFGSRVEGIESSSALEDMTGVVPFTALAAAPLRLTGWALGLT